MSVVFVTRKQSVWLHLAAVTSKQGWQPWCEGSQRVLSRGCGENKGRWGDGAVQSADQTKARGHPTSQAKGSQRTALPCSSPVALPCSLDESAPDFEPVLIKPVSSETASGFLSQFLELAASTLEVSIRNRAAQLGGWGWGRE